MAEDNGCRAGGQRRSASLGRGSVCLSGGRPALGLVRVEPWFVVRGGDAEGNADFQRDSRVR